MDQINDSDGYPRLGPHPRCSDTPFFILISKHMVESARVEKKAPVFTSSNGLSSTRVSVTAENRVDGFRILLNDLRT